MEVLRPELSVPPKLPPVSMSRDQSNLLDLMTLLERQADRVVSQIVEA